MNNVMNTFFFRPSDNALSRTLIHSLWQGACLPAVIGIVMICTRRTSSAVRYNVLAVANELFVVVVISTFILEVGTAEPAPNIGRQLYSQF